MFQFFYPCGKFADNPSQDGYFLLKRTSIEAVQGIMCSGNARPLFEDAWFLFVVQRFHRICIRRPECLVAYRDQRRSQCQQGGNNEHAEIHGGAIRKIL